jgi:hypothetical protein
MIYINFDRPKQQKRKFQAQERVVKYESDFSIMAGLIIEITDLTFLS